MVERARMGVMFGRVAWVARETRRAWRERGATRNMVDVQVVEEGEERGRGRRGGRGRAGVSEVREVVPLIYLYLTDQRQRKKGR